MEEAARSCKAGESIAVKYYADVSAPILVARARHVEFKALINAKCAALASLALIYLVLQWLLKSVLMKYNINQAYWNEGSDASVRCYI